MAMIKQQTDYIIMLSYIEYILNKEEKEPISGSIIIGKKYANTYLNKINIMLESEQINMEILQELKREIVTDMKIIEADTAFRGYIQNGKDNVKMMAMISDFIISL